MLVPVVVLVPVVTGNAPVDTEVPVLVPVVTGTAPVFAVSAERPLVSVGVVTTLAAGCK